MLGPGGPENVATPFGGLAEVVPERVPFPGFVAMPRVTAVDHHLTRPTPPPSSTSTWMGRPLEARGRNTSPVMSLAFCSLAGWVRKASEHWPTRSMAGCGPVITKSFPVPLKSFDCLTKLVNVYGARVALHSVVAVAESLTDIPGARLILRRWRTPPR